MAARRLVLALLFLQPLQPFSVDMLTPVLKGFWTIPSLNLKYNLSD